MTTSSRLSTGNARRAIRFAVFTLAGCLVVSSPFFMGGGYVRISTLVLFTLAGAAPLNLVSGTAGLFSLGYVGFLALGGFTSGVLAQIYGLNVLVCLFGAAIVGAIAGSVVALPTLRWRGMYVIMGTLALHFLALYGVIKGATALGYSTGFKFPAITVLGRALYTDNDWFYVMLTLASASVYVCATLARSHVGRAWIAARENRIVSEAIGINAGRGSIRALTTSSALIGLVGGMYGYFVGVFSFEALTLTLAIEYVAIILLGGLGSTFGAFLGSLCYVGIPYFVSWSMGLLPGTVYDLVLPYKSYVEVGVFGVMIVLIVLFEPRGLSYIARRAIQRLQLASGGRVAQDWPQSVPSPPTAAPAREVGGERRASSPAEVLQVEGLIVVYGQSGPALNGVSFSLTGGSVLGIVGANGAGKSTLVRAIGGYSPWETARVVNGSITWRGEDVVGVAPNKIAQLGIVTVPEIDKIFPNLTVREHLTLISGASRERAFTLESIFELFPPLLEHVSRSAGYLSGGERQMLAVARALRQGPELLILDELSLGLAPIVVTRLVEALETLAGKGGLTIIIVEQAVEIASRLTQDLIVLERGRLVGRGAPHALAAAGTLESAYLGLGTGQQP